MKLLVSELRLTRLLCALLFWTLPAFAADERVVVTIKPLHSLIQGIVGDDVPVGLLLTSADSVHGYNLKPSQVKQMNDADLVFYIDDDLELFLGDLGERGVRTGTFVSHLLPTRKEAGEHEDEHGHEDEDKHGHEDEHGHEEEHGHEHEDEHGHEHGSYDLHVWLDVKNAQAIVRQSARRLGEQYPHNRARYEENSRRLIKRLAMLDEALTAQLAPLTDTHYIVMHDAYQYIEKRYRLQPPAAILSSGHAPPSAKRLRQARRQIEEHGVRCIFREPQFSDRAIQALVGDDKEVRVETLDPLAGKLEAGEGLYFALMHQIVDNIQLCFAPETMQ